MGSLEVVEGSVAELVAGATSPPYGPPGIGSRN
jgi:hypothetical protein